MKLLRSCPCPTAVAMPNFNPCTTRKLPAFATSDDGNNVCPGEKPIARPRSMCGRMRKSLVTPVNRLNCSKDRMRNKPLFKCYHIRWTVLHDPTATTKSKPPKATAKQSCNRQVLKLPRGKLNLSQKAERAVVNYILWQRLEKHCEGESISDKSWGDIRFKHYLKTITNTFCHRINII